MDLFNFYSKAILKELEVQTGFIIGGQNLSNVAIQMTLMMADIERKLQELLDKIVKESSKKGLTINCKQTECMDVSKRNSPSSKLQIRDVKIKQKQSFKYLRSVTLKSKSAL